MQAHIGRERSSVSPRSPGSNRALWLACSRIEIPWAWTQTGVALRVVALMSRSVRRASPGLSLEVTTRTGQTSPTRTRSLST